MALDAPLNDKQIEVLQWISDGCPDGRWSDFTFKTTATALASRRLVSVSKRGGAWAAVILPAGEHYLAKGQYPVGHWSKRRRHVTDLEAAAHHAVRRPVASHDSTGVSPKPKPQKSSASTELTPTRKLVKQIVDAGGMLEIDTRDDKTNYQSLVGMINRHKMTPDGQELIMLMGRTYNHKLFRLSNVSDWQTASPAEVVAADRIVRWHPAVATLRADKRLDGIEKDLRGTAFCLLHALAREAEARGHRVRLPQRGRHGHIQDASKL